MAPLKKFPDSRRRGRRTPWSYRPGRSPLHRCPAGLKLILTALFAAVPAGGSPLMGGAAALIILGGLSSGIKPWELLAGSRPLLFMLGALTVFRSLDIPPALNLEGLTGGLLFSGGILISFSACSLLFTVTTMTEIRRSLERAEFLIRRIIPGRKPPAGSRGRLSLAMALMLGFLPQFFVLWEEAELACRARGASRGLRSMGAILPLVTERMIKTAAETAETLEARGLEL